MEVSLRSEIPGLLSCPGVCQQYLSASEGSNRQLQAPGHSARAHSQHQTRCAAQAPVPAQRRVGTPARAAEPGAALQVRPARRQGAAKARTSRKRLSGDQQENTGGSVVGKRGRVAAFPEQRHPHRKQ